MDTRKLIEETQRIANAAYYETNGRRITFEDPDGLSTACVYNPTFIKECVDNMRRAEAEEHQRTEYVVAQDDSFVAARLYGSGKTIVLNFANAYHPGGGFLAGSTAKRKCSVVAVHYTNPFQVIQHENCMIITVLIMAPTVQIM